MSRGALEQFRRRWKFRRGGRPAHAHKAGRRALSLYVCFRRRFRRFRTRAQHRLGRPFAVSPRQQGMRALASSCGVQACRNRIPAMAAAWAAPTNPRQTHPSARPYAMPACGFRRILRARGRMPTVHANGLKRRRQRRLIRFQKAAHNRPIRVGGRRHDRLFTISVRARGRTYVHTSLYSAA